MQPLCKFGQKCWNQSKCRFYHPNCHQQAPKYCRYGQRCRNIYNCEFYHPRKTAHHPNYTQFNECMPNLSNFQTMSQPDLKTVVKNDGQICVSSKENIVQAKTEASKHNQEQIQNCEQNQNKINKNLQKSQSESKSQKLNALNQIHTGQQEYLQKLLQNFFNVRLVKSNKFDEIYTLISQNFSLEEVPTVIEYLQKLQESKYNSYFTYLKFVRTISKLGLNFDKICQKLEGQLKIKLKKEQKQDQLIKEFPNSIKYDVLSDLQLMNLVEETKKQQKGTKIIFLVDGDNVLNTHKILRKYKLRKQKKVYIQGQIRLKWLLSQLQNCVLFFDYERMSSMDYDEVANKIMYKQQVQNYQKQNWKFANEYKQQVLQNNVQQCQEQHSEHSSESTQKKQCQNEQQQQQIDEKEETNKLKMTADELILDWIKQNWAKNCQENQFTTNSSKVILITADRILIQKSLQLCPQIQISSGKFFIKYCKEHIRRKYFGNKHKKAVLKRIFIQPRT